MKNPVIAQIERAAKKMAEAQTAPRPFRPAKPSFNADARLRAQREAFDPWVFIEDLQRFVHRGERRLVEPLKWRHMMPYELVGRGGHVISKVRKQIIPLRRFQSVVWEPEGAEFPRHGVYNLYRPDDGETEPDWIGPVLQRRVRIQRR